MKLDPSYLTLGLLLVAASGVVLTATVGNRVPTPPPKQRSYVATPVEQPKPEVVEKVEEVVEEVVEEAKEEKELVEEVVEEAKVEEVTNIPGEQPSEAFPEMKVEDAESELASAYTYGNLQESMLNEAMDVKRNIRSRPAFSRLGDRANPEHWDAQLREVRQQIRDSGQSLNDFMNSAWTPIPEQLASLWESEESASAVPEVRSRKSRTMTREAMAEAAFLTREAMQEISVRDPKEAKARMKEIFASRVRAKSLELNIPDLSVDQKRALEVWKSAEPDLVKSILEL